MDNHTWHPHVVVDPANIVEIFDASKDPNVSFPPPPPAPAQPLPFVPGPVPTHVPPQPDTKTATPPAPVLADPAILSFRPRTDRPGSGFSQGRSASQTRISAAAADNASLRTASHSTPNVNVHVRDSSRDATPVSTRSGPRNGLSQPSDAPTVADVSNAATTAAPAQSALRKERRQEARQEAPPKARRRQRQSRGVVNNSQANDGADLTPDRPQQHLGKGKGWRETPILQSTASFQPFSSLKKSGQRRQNKGQDNGWASEDVTDVQEMGDFDFEQSLAKFDKRTLFDQMRKDDLIDDADRLVTHNRKPAPKPGTAGGKNYHHTENVLDTPVPATAMAPMTSSKILNKEPQTTAQDFWNSEADDTRVAGPVAGVAAGVAGSGDRSSGRELGSRQGSRRGESRVSTTRRSQSRKASTAAVGPRLSRVNSVAVSLLSNQFAWG